MTAAQINYTNLESIIRNNPRVRALVDAAEHGDTPAVQRASRRRAGAKTRTSDAPTSALNLPAASTTAGVAQ
jgi:hypothetical protein